jgi:predicted transcriptional regulator
MNTNIGTARVTTLAEWLLEEIQRRQMSVREFGRFADIPHSTLNKLLNWDTTPSGDVYPALSTLVKLSNATGTDICTLVALVAPEYTISDADALVLANRIRNLPPDGRAVVEEWLIGRLLKRGNKSE